MDQIVQADDLTLEEELEAAGLVATEPTSSKIGESRQVRSLLREKDSDRFVAFFCQFTVLKCEGYGEQRKRTEITCINGHVVKSPEAKCRAYPLEQRQRVWAEKGKPSDISEQQRQAAERWIRDMGDIYPGESFGHSSY